MREKGNSKVRPPFMHSSELKTSDAVPAPKPVESKPLRPGNFDWKTAPGVRASDGPSRREDESWNVTEWDEPVPTLSAAARGAAEQLDAVAQRIRKGELTVEGSIPTPETAIVAALEALIRSK